MRSERAIPNSPRVLAVIGSNSACEVYRIFNPFLHLRALGYTCDWVHAERLAKVDVTPYDVIVTPRLGLDTQAERDGFYADMYSLGKTVVYEIDDDLLNMPPSNPAAFTPDETAAIRDMIARADLVTVSTSHLANRLRKLNPDVVTLPNCVDPDLWSFPKGRIRQIEGLTIGVHGGMSHYADWALLFGVFREVHRRYPEVKFVVAGYHPDYLLDLAPELGDRLVLLDWVPIEYYPVLVAQIDVGLCPLIDDTFNRSKCVVGSTLVSTETGLRPISELHSARLVDQILPLEARVWTEEGLRMATGFYYGGEQDTLRVRTRAGFEIEGTLDHRVKLADGTWAELQELRLGDELALAPISLAERYVEVRFNPWSMKQHAKPDLAAPSLPTLQVDGNWARFLGYLVGDGHIARGGVRVTCDLQDQDVIADVHETLCALGLSGRINSQPSDGRRCQDVGASSLRLNDLLERLGVRQEKRKVLAVPSVVLQSPRSVVREFLRGLFESDGTVMATGSSVTFCTASLRLAREVQLLFTGFGILSTIGVSRNHHYERDYHIVRLGRAATDIFAREIGFVGARKNARLAAIANKRHGNAFKEPVWSSEIVEIVRGRSEVFDITVPGPAHFLANGLVAHNSPIKMMENAMVGAPSVCSPTVYGRVVNHGTTGFLARDPVEWVACISRLIERPAYRRAVGAAARGFVLRQLNIHESATRWMDAYRQAWQRVTRTGHRTRATGVLA